MTDRLTEQQVIDLIGGLREEEPARDLVSRALARGASSSGKKLHYALFSSPVGPVLVAFSDAVVRSQVGGSAIEFETALAEEGFEGSRSDAPGALRAAVCATLEGGESFAYPVDMARLGRFQRQVLSCIRAIPRGGIRSYGWVAREIGRPGAVRAVGTALARNPIPVFIPCHRVVRWDRQLGEYSGGGSAMKAALLRWEGVPVVSRGERHWVTAAAQ
jgi:methylated-DNA-[protein]-cysteine S-methyltransferase